MTTSIHNQLTKQEDSVVHSGQPHSIHRPGQSGRADLLPARAGPEQFSCVQIVDMLIIAPSDQEHLRRDGIFLLRLVAKNAGHMVATEMLCGLWDQYGPKHRLLIQNAGAGKAGKIGKAGKNSRRQQGADLVAAGNSSSSPSSPGHPGHGQRMEVV